MKLAHERARITTNPHQARATPEAAFPGTGPAVFLAAHPLAYGLSLAGSGGAALYGFTVARRDSRYRVLWLALGSHCTAQFVGIVIATEAARRRERTDR